MDRLRLRRRTRSLTATLLIGAALLVGCAGDDSGGAVAQGIGFANPDSDVVAVLQPLQAGDATIVLLRGESAERATYIEFVHDDGSASEAVLDQSARLSELSLLDHRLVFSDYTTSQVTVTHYAPDGSTDTEQLRLDAADEAATGMPAALTDENGSEDDATEREVRDTLMWFADPRNYHVSLMPLKKISDALEMKWANLKQQADRRLESAKLLGTQLGNELSCLTATRQRCAQQVAQQAPTLVQELRAIDPSAATSAGFEVSDQRISPKRDEWDVEIARGTIPTEFTLTDVPCEESVFADMNPACPQYVSPSTAMNGDDPVNGDDPMNRDDPMNGDDPTMCTSASFGNDDFLYTCAEYSEEYKGVLAGSLYLRFHPTTGQIRDQLSLNIVDGAIFSYSVDDYEYDAQGAFMRRDSITINISTHDSSHMIVTSLGGDERMTVVVDCYNTTSHRYATKGPENDISGLENLSDVSDNDLSECATVDKVKALGMAVFPEASMSMEYVQASPAYQAYAAAH